MTVCMFTKIDELMECWGRLLVSFKEQLDFFRSSHPLMSLSPNHFNLHAHLPDKLDVYCCLLKGCTAGDTSMCLHQRKGHKDRSKG